jgi:N-acetylmuramic acid 6-phosphate (MurNAc-6-P) etherase
VRILQQAAGISEHRAQKLLARTNQEVKTALVVALTGATIRKAEQALDNAGGHIRKTLALLD